MSQSTFGVRLRNDICYLIPLPLRRHRVLFRSRADPDAVEKE